MDPSRPLPPAFKSVYRLFLRATSASVLHKTWAVKSLRKLWKPIFVTAAVNVKKLESPEYSAEHENLRRWMLMWESRGVSSCIAPNCAADICSVVDNTMAMLYNSSHTNGLPHKLTRNLAQLSKNLSDARLTKRDIWVPNLDPSSSRYQVRAVVGSSDTVRINAEKARRKFDAESWSAIGQVIRLAEGRNGLSLGRVTRTRAL